MKKGQSESTAWGLRILVGVFLVVILVLITVYILPRILSVVK